jgi:hypothetical protein
VNRVHLCNDFESSANVNLAFSQGLTSSRLLGNYVHVPINKLLHDEGDEEWRVFGAGIKVSYSAIACPINCKRISANV